CRPEKRAYDSPSECVVQKKGHAAHDGLEIKFRQRLAVSALLRSAASLFSVHHVGIGVRLECAAAMFSTQRQPENESRSFVCSVAEGFNRAVVKLDDFTHDRQTKTQTTSLKFGRAILLTE